MTTRTLIPSGQLSLFTTEEVEPVRLVPMEELTARLVLGWDGPLATRQIAQVHQLQLRSLHPTYQGFEVQVRLLDLARDCLMRLAINAKDCPVLIDAGLQKAILWQRDATA